MIVYLYLLMLLCHIIDDFVLQPVCLSNLKQKSWWEKNASDGKYKDDYLAALAIHAASWSIMIHLPIMYFIHPNYVLLGITFLLNMLIHFYVDDLKANKKKINLQVDQSIHIWQILITLLIYIFI